MQTVPRALVNPLGCINILSKMLCRTLYTEIFFIFVKPNSSISRQGQVIPPTPSQQQYHEMTPKISPGIGVTVHVHNHTSVSPN